MRLSTFLLLLLMLWASHSLSAQDSLRQGRVQLIDGSVFQGQVLERGAEFTRVKIITGDVLVLNNNLITSIDDEAIRDRRVPKRFALKKEGKYRIFSTGLLIGRDARSLRLISSVSLLHFVMGKRLNQYLGLGGGFGIDIYQRGFFPLYADFRGNVKLNNTVLFYAMQCGYAPSSDNLDNSEGTSYSGGLMLYPAFGFRWATRGRSDILLEFGLRHQWTKRRYSWRSDVDRIIFRRYGLRLGVAF